MQIFAGRFAAKLQVKASAVNNDMMLYLIAAVHRNEMLVNRSRCQTESFMSGDYKGGLRVPVGFRQYLRNQ